MARLDRLKQFLVTKKADVLVVCIDVQRIETRQINFARFKIDELLDVADADLIMPPKSTWFEPKPRSGFVVRTFE